MEAHHAEDAICFGPFVIFPQQHLLLKDGQPMPLRSRALLLLIAMATRAGELVEKGELLSLVWPKVVVEECNLRAQVVTLRRALGGDGDFDYIVTVPGRGYRFVAPIIRHNLACVVPTVVDTAPELPRSMIDIIGRDALLDTVAEQLERCRFITLTGPAGIGKTTVALALANRLAEQFPQGISLIDLASVSRGQLVSVVIASALGINASTEDPLQSVTNSLSHSRVLLILDNCEHLLEETAVAVETILRSATHCCALITSREPLHAEGEFVHELESLRVPEENSPLNASQALMYSSIQLLVERVTAHDQGYVFNDHDVQAAAAICRKLDGNPLAIEIASARFRAFGSAQLVELLDGTFRLQMTGRRTALPRHRTLSAALDWTYSMLCADEQAMLRQLSVFKNSFSLSAVKAVFDIAATDARDPTQLLESLIDKSLLLTCEKDSVIRYRLLETTRLYAWEKLAQNAEVPAISSRHANYALDALRQALQNLITTPPQVWLALYGPLIDTARVALDWAYSAHGDQALGVELTLVSVPLWLRLSLVAECDDWVNRGLQTTEDATPIEPHQRMLLLTVSASVMLLTYGCGAKVRDAWQRVSDDARILNDTEHQLLALWGLWNDRCCSNHHVESLKLADRYLDLNNRAGSPDRKLLGNRMRATALYYMADLEGALQSINEALCSPLSSNAHIIDLHFDQRIAARSLKAQIQLLQGHVDEALLNIDDNVMQAITLNHPASLWYTLCLSAIPATLMVGHLDNARDYLALLQNSLLGNELHLWCQFARCFEHILLIRQGSPEDGVPRLGEELLQLQDQGDGPLYSLICSEYAQGLALLGLEQIGLQVLSETLQTAQTRQERWFLPELLRIKARLLCRRDQPCQLSLAHATLDQALAEAQAQGSSFWTSRITADIAQLAVSDLQAAGQTCSES